jgi:hypothetical protein
MISVLLRRPRWLLYAAAQLVALLAPLLAILLAPLAPGGTLPLDAQHDPGDLAGFWQPEQNAGSFFRWTNGHGIIWIDDYADRHTLLVRLRLSAPLTPDRQATQLTLQSDERRLGTVAVAREWRVYQLLATPGGLTWRTPNLDLISPTSRGGASDLRSLGVALSAADLRPLGGRLPLPLLLRAGALLVVMLVIRAALQLRIPAGPAIGASALAGLGLVLARYQDPAGFDRALPSPWLALLLLSAAWLVLLELWRDRGGLSGSLCGTLRTALLAGPLLLFAGATALFSLQWRMLHDAPLLMYIAWLIDQQHLAPYRDIFDQNMPGALLFYVLVGRATGYTDLGFRIVDLLLLGLLSGLTWLWCAPLSRRAALISTVTFAWIYLQYGPSISMQRDFVLLIPVAAALVASRVGRLPLSCWLIGLCFGIAASIKPHAIFALPFVCWYRLAQALGGNEPAAGRPHTIYLRALGWAALGLLIAPVLCAAYLVQVGALGAFWEMAWQYLPLFARINGLHHTLDSSERLGYLVRGTLGLGGQYAWLLAAALGAGVALWRGRLAPPQRRAVLLAAGMAAAYSLYPAVQGRFWEYHWLPLLYSLSLLVGLCGLPWPHERAVVRLAPALALLLALGLHTAAPLELGYQATGHALPPIKDGRVDSIAGFLSARLRPGDTVQPLDWTGGALHAMLLARAPLATPFIYEFQFTHDIDRPYIQELRRRFIAQLRARPPRFIVDMGDYSTVISGPGTSASFPELDELIAQRYTSVFQGQGYRILERR